MFKSIFTKYITAFMLITLVSFLLLALIMSSLISNYSSDAKKALVENAVKYNVPDGSVWLRLHGDEKTVTLSVEDSGIGIPEEDRLNIFSRFYRVDKARSRASGGTGLGLSIVHDAVLAHGGSIAVGANKPQGSIFVVSFPRPDEEETGI